MLSYSFFSLDKNDLTTMSSKNITINGDSTVGNVSVPKRKIFSVHEIKEKRRKTNDDPIRSNSNNENVLLPKRKTFKESKEGIRKNTNYSKVKEKVKESEEIHYTNNEIAHATSLNKLWKDEEYLAELEEISLNTSKNIIKLLNDENSIPFIARYRKDLIGDIKPEKLRKIKYTYEYITQVRKKASQLIKLISANDSPPPQLLFSIQNARSLEDLEFLGAPYKKNSKRTLAERAKKLGLEKPSHDILRGETVNLNQYTQVDVEGLANEAEVKLGIQHIIADVISKDAEVLCLLENMQSSNKIIIQSKFKKSKAEPTSNQAKYILYENFSHSVQAIKPHQILAVNRGEKEKYLSVKIVIPEFLWNPVKFLCEKKWITPKDERKIIQDSVDDAIKRLLNPLLMRRIRAKLNIKAQEEAINIFAHNLQQLLLLPPCPGKVILAIDPGFKNGCKVAVISSNGNLLDHDKFFLKNPELAATKLINLARKHNCSTIALGNGQGCREAESLLCRLIRDGCFQPLNVSYAIVNEQGVSVYSCSPLAQEEFPDLEPTVISAISLGRRLQNPLSELVKVEPRHLGVGMYQHDVDEAKLAAILEEVVTECVSFVGVDVNTASVYLLKRVAGLTERKAKEIVKYRNENCSFRNREQLKNVKGIKSKTFQQCAGFIRVKPSTAGCKKHSHEAEDLNPLDETSIHPESYESATRLIEMFGLSVKDLGSADFINFFKKMTENKNLEEISKKFGCSVISIEFITDTLSKPKNFDIRQLSSESLFKKEIKKLEDISSGQVLTGVVHNVVSFGAFVDVGVGTNGLIHVSNMRNTAIGLNNKVKVKVLSIKEKRIALKLISVIEHTEEKGISKTTDMPKLFEEYNSLLEKEKKLDEEIILWREKSNEKHEMKLLHKYNEVKDAAQVILGAIANLQGVTVKELHKKFDLPLTD